MTSQQYRGAPLGLPAGPAQHPTGPLTAARVKLDAGGYDAGGNYWGLGKPLYCVVDDSGQYRRYIRGNSKRIVLSTFLPCSTTPT